MIYRLLFLFLFLPLASVFGQELQCKVNLNYSQLSTNTSGDREIFAELERAVNDFMNNQKWTNDIFRADEKIKCNLNINLIKSSGQFQYSGNAQFQVIRPVFGTTYETVLLSFVDRNFEVSFAPESRQMLFNEQIFTNNVTSMLGFYSLIALTLDYDSFSRYGGNPFVDRLFNIVNLAGNGVGGAWSSTADIRDRYWIMENLRSQQFAVFREGFYKYHRLGLDELVAKPEEARKVIFDYLKELQTLNALRPNATILNLFFDAKSEEITNVFSEAPKKEREAVYKICSGINPDKTETYRRLLR
jgi:hypothetical protein